MIEPFHCDHGGCLLLMTMFTQGAQQPPHISLNLMIFFSLALHAGHSVHCAIHCAIVQCVTLQAKCTVTLCQRTHIEFTNEKLLTH